MPRALPVLACWRPDGRGAGLAGCFVLLALASAGCSTGPHLTKVTGTVSFGGVPLTNGSISFVAEDGGENAAGIINSRGEYTLRAHLRGDGAAPGRYRVCISSFEKPPTMEENSGRRAIPAKYFDVRHSGLTATVEDRRTQVIDFPLPRE